MNQNEKEIEKNIKTVFGEVLSKKNFNLLDKLYTPEAIFYDGEQKFVGRNSIKELILKRHPSIPDLEYILDDIMIIGDRASVRWHAKGKAINDIAGFKAGHSADYWGISMFEFADGLIAKNWSNSSIQDAPKL